MIVKVILKNILLFTSFILVKGDIFYKHCTCIKDNVLSTTNRDATKICCNENKYGSLEDPPVGRFNCLMHYEDIQINDFANCCKRLNNPNYTCE
jgi:hypothetical protein